MLLTNILQSISIYVLSTIDTPRYVIRNYIEFCKFFLNSKEFEMSKHWSAWDKVCLPKKVGELEFRSLNDVSKAMHSKLLWRFRIKKSMN